MADTTKRSSPALRKPAIIYGLIDPRTNIVCYVGKATDMALRMRQHVRDAGKKAPRCGWIRDLLAAGLLPGVIELEEVSAGADWSAAERRQIAAHRQINPALLNRTNGGQGPDGIERAPEWRENHAKAMKEVGLRKRGKPMPPATRDALRAANTGRKMSNEQKALLSKIKKGRASLPGEVERLREANLGKRHTPETRAKMSAWHQAHRQENAERQRVAWFDPAFREKALGKRGPGRMSPEGRAALSDCRRGEWTDPAIRRRRTDGMRQALSAPSYRAAKSEELRRKWQDPAFREMMLRARSNKARAKTV